MNETRYFILNKINLIKITPSIVEEWRLDEHRFYVKHTIQENDNVQDYVNFIYSIDKMDVAEISESKFNDILNDFNTLMQKQDNIFQMKLDYMKTFKDYVNKISH